MKGRVRPWDLMKTTLQDSGLITSQWCFETLVRLNVQQDHLHGNSLLEYLIPSCHPHSLGDFDTIIHLEPVNEFLHHVFVSLVSLADLEAFDDDTSSLARLSILWVADGRRGFWEFEMNSSNPKTTRTGIGTYRRFHLSSKLWTRRPWLEASLTWPSESRHDRFQVDWHHVPGPRHCRWSHSSHGSNPDLPQRGQPDLSLVLCNTHFCSKGVAQTWARHPCHDPRSLIPYRQPHVPGLSIALSRYHRTSRKIEGSSVSVQRYLESQLQQRWIIKLFALWTQFLNARRYCPGNRKLMREHIGVIVRRSSLKWSPRSKWYFPVMIVRKPGAQGKTLNGCWVYICPCWSLWIVEVILEHLQRYISLEVSMLHGTYCEPLMTDMGTFTLTTFMQRGRDIPHVFSMTWWIGTTQMSSTRKWWFG